MSETLSLFTPGDQLAEVTDHLRRRIRAEEAKLDMNTLVGAGVAIHEGQGRIAGLREALSAIERKTT